MATPFASYTIKPLTSRNYITWCNDVKFVLQERKAWDIVKGIETLESDPAKTAKEIEDFKTRSQTAFTTIYMSISEDFKRIISNCSTVVEAWGKLREHFTPDNRSQHMSLFSELCNCFIKPKESIDLYASRLREISEQMLNMNKPIDETLLSFQLLRYLPQNFDTIVQTILRWDDKDFKFDKIVKELIAEESRQRTREQDKRVVPQVEAYKTTKFKPTRREVRCYRCNNLGHYQQDCRTKFKSDKPNSQKKYDSKPPYRRSNSRNRDFSETSQSDTSPERSQQQQKFNKKGNLKKKQNFNDKQTFFLQANLTQSGNDSNQFVFDTAASHHFVHDKNLLHSFSPINGERLSVAIEGSTYAIEGKGGMRLRNGPRIIEFCNVMYVPTLKRNLISGPQMDRNGARFEGGGGLVKVFGPTNNFLFQAKISNGLYLFQAKPVVTEPKHVTFSANTSSTSERYLSYLDLWHKRLGHTSPSLIEKMVHKKCVRGFPDLNFKDYECEVCTLNKFKRVSFQGIGKIRSTGPGQLIHTDLCGPTKNEGRSGERYYLSVIDDYSRYATTYSFINKYETGEMLKHHITKMETRLGTKLKAVRSDNGGGGSMLTIHSKNISRKKVLPMS